MATTATVAKDSVFGDLHVQIVDVEIGGSDTEASWSTGLNNVMFAGVTTTADQAFGGVWLNYSDAGTTVAAGTIYIAGLANGSVLKVLVLGA